MPAPNPVRELIRRHVADRVPYGAFRDRYEIFDPFTQAPSDGHLWTLSGTNNGTGSDDEHANGGVELETAGADDDQLILSPAAALTTTRWDPQHETHFEAILEIPSTADAIVKAGLALTNAMDRTTDDDQAAFVFDAEGGVTTANFTAIESVDGSDAETDTEVEVETGQAYRLDIQISDSGVPRYYINNVKVHTGNALTADAQIKPFIGVQALAASAKAVRVLGMRISRVLPAA